MDGKVLLWEVNERWSDVDRKVTKDMNVAFCGFNTLDQKNKKDICAAGDFDKLRRVGQCPKNIQSG